jgi:hypothetical protein
MVMHSMRTRHLPLLKTNRAVVMIIPNLANIADVGDRLTIALSAGRGGGGPRENQGAAERKCDTINH